MTTRNVYFVPLVLLLWLFAFWQAALAQAKPNAAGPPFKVNGKEVKEYLTGKYGPKLRKDDLVSTLKQTPHGPEGTLYFRGDIVPKNAARARGIKNREDRARAVTMAFLEEEGGLFGIDNIAEMREIRIFTSEGYDGEYVTILYLRYIDGLELDRSYVRITTRPEIDKITSVAAELIPAPPELYAAVRSETLGRNEILDIVRQDLTSAGINAADMRLLSIKKVAVPSSPYVIWNVDINLRMQLGRWKYRIDAFTGEILEKRDALIQ
jgi:hypothetical protein